MKAMKTIGTVLVLPVTVWVAVGCSDGGSGRTPTDPALDPRNAQASFDRDRDDDGDNDGSGSKFRLFGNARMTQDPENGSNVVLEVVSSADFAAAGAARKLRVKIWQLDHQLNFHRAFVAPHSCGGGSPRIQLNIDADGDGDFEQGLDEDGNRSPDFAAHGHVRPPYTGCETGVPTPAPEKGASLSTLFWRFEDLTDEMLRWEITPGGAVEGIPVFPFVTWDILEEAVSRLFPKHRAIEGRLVEDFIITPPGVAYYDLITIFNSTLATKGQVTARKRDHDHDEDDRDR